MTRADIMRAGSAFWTMASAKLSSASATSVEGEGPAYQNMDDVPTASSRRPSCATFGAFAAGILLGAVGTLLGPISVAQQPVHGLRLAGGPGQLAKPESLLGNAWSPKFGGAAGTVKDLTWKDDEVKFRFDNRCAVDKLNRARTTLMHDHSAKFLRRDYLQEQLVEGEVPKPTSADETPSPLNKQIGVELYNSLLRLVSPYPQNASPLQLHEEFQQLCRQWVAYTTDAAWHAADAKHRNLAMQTFFAPDFKSSAYGYSIGGIFNYKGRENLTKIVEAKLKAVPDLKIRVLDCQCAPAVHAGNLVGIWTTMPDVSLGTPAETMTIKPPGAGPDGSVLQPTGLPVSYPGMAVTLVTPDQQGGLWYQSEMVIHEDASMLAALGGSSWSSAAPPSPQAASDHIVETFGGPVDRCEVLDWFGHEAGDAK